MDDIQLCKDIMDLKQELQNLVAIPGNHLQLHLVLNRCLGAPSLAHLYAWVWKTELHSCNAVLPDCMCQTQLRVRQTWVQVLVNSGHLLVLGQVTVLL